MQAATPSHYILDVSLYTIYTESNYLLVITKHGAIKFRIGTELVVDQLQGFMSLQERLLFQSSALSVDGIRAMLMALDSSTTSLSIGYRAKYKVIGLGWKAFYFKNYLFFKLGYSHLIFLFIPFEFKSFKKKKKKMYHTIVGMNKQHLNLFFARLKNLRISDIYSMNGIFDRACYMEFKEGKRSFLL